MIRMLRLFAVLAVVCLTVTCVVAQVATAELHVSVKDANGAVVKNASVTVRNDATNFERVQTGNLEGEYPFRALPPGHYTVTVDAPGFARAQAKNVTITVGQIAELPVSVQVASVSEVVNVSSTAEIIETQRSSSATTIDETRIGNLPINGRNYINFALTNSQLARDTAPSIGAAPTSGLNVGGQRARNNQVNVDGMDSVDNSTNGIRATVSQEAVQEFQLLTNGYAAEYGRASGGIVNIITKGGTNELHGSAFAYLRNRKIQATNPFSTIEDPAYTRVQTGLSFGGPIIKNKTFYFFSFETTRRHESGYSSIGQNNFGLTTNVDVSRFFGAPTGALVFPVTAQQAQILGVLPVNAATQQYAMATAVAGNVALNGVNPVFGALVPGSQGRLFANLNSATGTPMLLPQSFVGLNSLRGNFPIFEGTSIYSLRLDHKLTNNQTLLLRGSASPSTADGIQVQAQGPQNFGQNAWSRTSEQQFRDMSVGAQHAWTIGSNKVNEFRYQFSRRGLLYSYSRKAPGGSNVAVNIPGVAFFGREPFSYVDRTELRHQFTDNFTWSMGSHTFKFGADYNHLPLDADFTVNFGGIYNFGDIGTPSGLPAGTCAALGLGNQANCNLPITAVQAYGMGIPQNFIQGVGNPHDEFTQKTLGTFVQDSWRITRNLTLNYGVRYDVEFTPTFAATTALAQAAQDQLGITQGIPRDYNNIAPRIGIAWDPYGQGKTVIRASYGMFYDHPLLALGFNSDVADGSQAPQIVLFGARPGGCGLNAGNLFTGVFGSCPLAGPLNYVAAEQRFDPTPNAPSAWRDQAFLTAGPGGTPLGLSMLPFGFPTAKDFVYPYSNQANFTIEHDFGHDFAGSIQYNFNGGRHLNRPINANPVRTDLLVQNWQVAMNDPAWNASAATQAARGGFANDPRSVTTPTGLPIAQYTAGGQTFTYVIPATVSFFRPSGVNIGLIPYNTTASPANPYFLLRQYLNAVGLPDMGPIPFSDMPANYSNGSSVYHGLTVNGRKRFSSKYEFLASYTWAHTIDDSTDLQSPLSPQDNYRPDLERSTSLFDQRHRFVFSAVYNSGKVFNGNAFLSGLLSDWTIAPIVEYASGRPFNIITGSDQNYDFGTTTDRPRVVGGPMSDACGQTAVQTEYGWLIPACFKDGVFTGNLGRNAGRKPSNVFNDIRVARRINFGERWKMDAIMDVFNVANKFNVADVNPLWNRAGEPTAAFDPRQFQFALRLSF